MNDPCCLAAFDAASCDLLEPSTTLRDRLGANACSRLWTELAALRAEAEHAQSIDHIDALVARCVEIFDSVPETAALMDRYRDIADRIHRGTDMAIAQRAAGFGHLDGWQREGA